MSLFENKSVKAVREALAAAGSHAEIVKLEKAAKTVEDVAGAVRVAPGAVVLGHVFVVGDTPVLALVAGDRVCRPDALGRALNLAGAVRVPDDAEARAITGFASGGTAPVGSKTAMACAIDVSLKRFDTIYALAGHPQYAFATTMAELKRLTGGIVSYAIVEESAARP